MKSTQDYVIGSGNFYQDLGFDDAEERLVKAKFAMHINDIIKERNLTQDEAGKILGISQSKVSRLANGRLQGFSMEKLILFLKALDQDISIEIKRKSSQLHTKPGHLTVVFA